MHEVRLGDLVNQRALLISDGYRVRNEELGPEGIPFVRGGDIGDGWINTTTVDHIRPEFADRVRAKLAGPEDVAFIAKGTVGRAGRLRVRQPHVVFAPQVAYWRVLDKDVLDPTFVFYLVRSREFQAALDGVKTHGSMVADYVSISQQYDFRFRLPDIQSQRAIGRILGALDDKIELNRRTSETLEAMARALFHSWFVDFDPVRANAEGRNLGLPKRIANAFPNRFEHSELGEIPVGWKIASVGDEVELVKGVSYRSEQLAPSETALVTLKSVNRGGGYRPDGLKEYTGAYKPDQVLKPGELVVAQTDVTQAAEVIGKPALVIPDDRYRMLVPSLDLMIVRPISAELSQEFFYLMFQTATFQDHVYGHTNGTTVLHLSKTGVPTFRFPRPSETVARVFNSVVGRLLRRVIKNARESRTLAALRDTLLPKLISGELRIRNAEKFAEAVV